MSEPVERERDPVTPPLAARPRQVGAGSADTAGPIAGRHRRRPDTRPGPGARRRGLLAGLALGVSGILLLVAFRSPLLAATGRWLAAADPLPPRADALVVVSGDPYGVREAEAARLWHAGLSPVVIVSGGPVAWQTVAADVMGRHLRELGVPASAILVEPEATSTRENALFTLPLLQRLGAREVVLVTSNYHVRRARLAFRQILEPAGIRVVVHGVPDPGFDPGRWWRQPQGLEYGLLELVKLAWYVAR